MRIGINALLLWGRFTGVEHSILNLVKALMQLNAPHELLVYLPVEFNTSLLNPIARQTEMTKLVRLKVATRFRLLRILCEQLYLPLRIIGDKLHLLHCPGYISVIASPVPVILTVYDILAITHPEWCRTANRLYYRLMLPISIRRARRIIVPSETVKRELVSTLSVDEDKVDVVPLGIDQRFFEPINESVVSNLRQRLRLPGRFILFVGNIEPKKNLPTLLKAYERLKKRMSDVGLVIVGAIAWGNGKLIDRAKAIGAQYLGYVSDEELRAVYRLASVLVFPSLYEGFGLPPLEAMALGTPVVASTAGALPEVLGNAALLVEPNDVDGLVEAIVSILSDEALYSALAERATAHASKFTWDEVARRVMKIYERAMRQLG
ncbi:MAG: glycosyltransferase family 1 protein [Armatimonadota bacterium]|nr:glycosyltransferase family 4 protein [Armatimonadota bacterium]MCX7777936.1 glycosyltransferase family 4 protein [Armatimonadota bacterium]MDW8025631.1 glycosyltransferase family 1 protein [Armatimonadota bacterium]